MRLIILFLMMFSLSIAVAGTRDPNVSDEKYIEYGKAFTFVGQLKGKTKSGSSYYASAVAIDPHWIVTAAHVASDVNTCDFIIDGKKIKIVELIYNKDFDSKFGLGDIAIGYSEEDICLSFYPELYKDTDELHKVCCISGYGYTGTFREGAVSIDNNRRAGSNYIDRIYSELLICTASPVNDKNRTSLEFLIASGDSGGGLFIDGKLAGINSCVLADDNDPDSTYRDEGAHTRISTYYEWIKENINEKKK